MYLPLLTRVLVLSVIVALVGIGGCQANRSSTTRPENATPQDAFRAYLDALFARDRDRLRALVFQPTDEERRQWVLKMIETGLMPPPGSSVISPTVTMDGPVAVCRGTNRLPDGTTEPSSPMFLVQRGGRWYFVIDMFEGGGLTEDELDVIGRQLPWTE